MSTATKDSKVRYVYSVVRFVPDPTRGEFVNIGLIAGSDETGEWELQTVARMSRAQRLDDTRVLLPQVMRQVAELAANLDAVTEARDALVPPRDLPDVSEAWITKLSRDWANIVQLSPPQPVVADDAQEVFDALWGRMIFERKTRGREITTKLTALKGVRESLRHHQIERRNIWERPTLKTTSSHSPIDLAVHNGRVLHITQCWSFQVADQEALLDDVKAWAWTVRDLRRGNGGEVSALDRSLEVRSDVPIAAVFVPPETGRTPTTTMEEALSAFADQDVRATAIPLDSVDRVGAEAAAKLAQA